MIRIKNILILIMNYRAYIYAEKHAVRLFDSIFFHFLSENIYFYIRND